MLLPSIPTLYRSACYGQGDAVRSDARTVLEAMAQERGVSIGDLLRRAGMDVGAYLFTKPRQPAAALVTKAEEASS